MPEFAVKPDGPTQGVLHRAFMQAFSFSNLDALILYDLGKNPDTIYSPGDAIDDRVKKLFVEIDAEDGWASLLAKARSRNPRHKGLREAVVRTLATAALQQLIPIFDLWAPSNVEKSYREITRGLVEIGTSAPSSIIEALRSLAEAGRGIGKDYLILQFVALLATKSPPPQDVVPSVIQWSEDARNLFRLDSDSDRFWPQYSLAVYAAVSCAVLLLILLFACVIPRIPQTLYCSELVRRHISPAPVGLLSPEEASSRSQSYRVTTINGQVVTVAAVNGHGAQTGEHSYPDFLQPAFAADFWSPAIKPCRWKYSYFSGRLAAEEAYDLADRFVYRIEYNATATTGVTIGAYQWNDGRRMARSASGANRVELTEDAKGFVSKVRYLDADQKPQPSDEHDFGRWYDCDGDGRTRSWTRLGADGHPLTHADGCIRNDLSYDADGRLASVAWHDVHGDINPHHKGPALVRYGYDRAGNRTHVEHRNAKDKLTRSASEYAKAEYKNNQYGDRTIEFFFDEHGARVNSVDGYAEAKHEYDEKGRLALTRFFDSNGRAGLHKQGYASVKYEYDERGQLRAKRFFAANDVPALTVDGYAQEFYTFDENGRLNQIDYLDAVGKLRRHTTNRFARVKYSYNGRSDVGTVNLYPTRFDYYGSDEQRSESQNGIASLVREYDHNNALTKEYYLDPFDKKKTGLNGIARMEFAVKYLILSAIPAPDLTKAHSAFRTVVTDYFDELDRPTRGSHGYTSVKIEYDAHGAKRREIRAGFDNNRGYEQSEQILDPQERLLEERYQNSLSKLVLNQQKFAIKKQEYDVSGNLFRVTYLGLDRELVENEDGIAREQFEYDGKGHEKERSFYRKNENLICSPSGFARRVQTWKGDRLASQAYFDEKKNFVRVTETGYARREWQWLEDADGIVEEKTWGGKDRKEVDLVVRRFDGRRNLLGESYFDRRENRVSVSGYATWRADFDKQMSWTRLSFQDSNGKPAISTSEWPPAEFVALGGGFPEPVRSYLRSRAEFFPIEVALLDLPPCRRGFGLADAVLAQQYIAMLTAFEASGHDSSDARTWPDRPLEVVAACMQLRPLFGGGWYTELRLEDQGKQIKISYHNADLPVRCRDGYLFLLRELGNGGVVKREVFKGFAEGNVASTLVREYDDLGRIMSEKYCNAAGASVKGLHGYALALWTYRNAAAGPLFQVKYFDEMNQPLATELIVGGMAPGSDLQVGDMIVAYAGEPVSTAADLAGVVVKDDVSQNKQVAGAGLAKKLALREFISPNSVEVRIRRGATSHTLQVRGDLAGIRFEDRAK